jgi:hypothetical protein
LVQSGHASAKPESIEIAARAALTKIEAIVRANPVLVMQLRSRLLTAKLPDNGAGLEAARAKRQR